MGFVHDYQRDVWGQHRLLPQYPPSGDLRIGDVMEKRDGVWKVRSNVASSGFKPKTSRGTSGDMSASSKGSLKIKTKAKGAAPSGAFGSVLGEADAGVHLTFTKSFGYALAASGVTETAMTNVGQLVEHIVRRQRWTWDLSFLIVTEIYRADATTLVTASTRGASTILKANTELKPGGVKVADLSGSFDLVAASQLDGRWVSEKNLTPLYGVKKIRLRDLLFAASEASSAFARARDVTGPGHLNDLVVDSLALPGGARFSVIVEDFDPDEDL
jgi:hypothetical protein